MAEKKETAKSAPAYTKAQILAAEKYNNRRDLLGALLSDDRSYTLDLVDAEIEKFRKGKVK